MDNLINETNARIQEIIDNLNTIKNEYENKLDINVATIEEELAKVKEYKQEFFTSKEKIEKMNADIEGFEEDYKNLVDRFKDDELANILIAANKEISAKIEERKRKIIKDKAAMNELVEKAENVKKKLVKLTAEKKALELCLEKINDSHEFYSKSLGQIIEYSEDNRDYLCACFYETDKNEENEIKEEKISQYEDIDLSEIAIDPETFDEDISFDENEIDNEEEVVDEDIISTDEDDVIIEENNAFEEKNDFEENTLLDETFEEEIVEENTIEDDIETNELDSIDLDEIPEIELDLVNDDSLDDTTPNLVEEINLETEEVIEGEEHEVIMEEMPSQEYNFDQSLDLENIVNFDDSLEDDDSLYEKEKEENE